MPASTVTSKGRITIPKEIRERLRVRAGQRVELQIDKDGQVVMRTRMGDFRALKGMVRHNRKSPVSLQEMNEAIARRF